MFQDFKRRPWSLIHTYTSSSFLQVFFIKHKHYKDACNNCEKLNCTCVCPMLQNYHKVVGIVSSVHCENISNIQSNMITLLN